MVLRSVLPHDTLPGRRLAAYSKLVRALSTQRDPQTMLKTYREHAQLVVPFDQYVSLSRRDLPAGQVRITRTSRWTEDINPWKEPHRLPLIDRGILLDLITAERPLKVDNLEIEPDDPFAPYAEGMQSLLAAPIYHEGDATHMIVLLRSGLDAFTLDELSTLLLTSNLIGNATNQLLMASELRRMNDLFEDELQRVGRVQRGMLPPTLPEIPGVRLATYYETSTQAGGDYYDFVQIADGRWGILLADVSGHGPNAAVVTAMLHALVNAPDFGCPRRLSNPAEVLQHLNASLLRMARDGQFVTAFFGVYDPQARTLEFANAGHNPPRWFRRESREVVALESGAGLPLGIVDEFGGSVSQMKVAPGDRLVLFTDGITETFGPGRELFGDDRLDEVIRRCDESPDSLIRAIVRSVEDFSANAPAGDDRTLVAALFD